MRASGSTDRRRTPTRSSSRRKPVPNPPTVVSSTNYSNASLFTITDPQGWGTGTLPATGQEGYLKYFNETDIADSFKIAATHELNAGIFKDLVFGMSYTERYKGDAQAPTGYLVNSDGKPQDPLPPLQGTTDLTWIGNLKPIAWSANGLVSSGALKLLPNPNPGTYVGDNYQVWEDVTRPFIKFDLKGNVFSVPFDGNIGVVADVANQNSIG